MTHNRSKSKWMLACAAAMVAAMTSRAAAQQPSEAHIRELIRQAAERVASGQTGAPSLAQTPGAGLSRFRRRVGSPRVILPCVSTVPFG